MLAHRAEPRKAVLNILKRPVTRRGISLDSCLYFICLSVSLRLTQGEHFTRRFTESPCAAVLLLEFQSFKSDSSYASVRA
jgi:hypothetical protein